MFVLMRSRLILRDSADTWLDLEVGVPRLVRTAGYIGRGEVLEMFSHLRCVAYDRNSRQIGTGIVAALSAHKELCCFGAYAQLCRGRFPAQSILHFLTQPLFCRLRFIVTIFRACMGWVCIAFRHSISWCRGQPTNSFVYIDEHI